MGIKGTPVHSLCYLYLTVVTLITIVNNVHVSGPWLDTVGLVAHTLAYSLFLKLCLIYLVLHSKYYMYTDTETYTALLYLGCVIKFLLNFL